MNSGHTEDRQQVYQIPDMAGSTNQEGLTTHAEVFETQQAQEPTEQEPTAQELTGINEIREFIGSLVSHGEEGREGHNDDHTGQVTETSHEGLADNKASHTEEEITPEAAEQAAARAMAVSKELSLCRDNAMSGSAQ